LGKPASLHATTAFLASNVYAGQHPKPQHWAPTPKGKPCIGSSDRDYYNLPILAGIQPTEHSRSGATMSQAHRAMEPGHLLHSVLLCVLSAVPQIDTPICTRRTITHQFILQQQHMCSTLGGSPMECGVGGQPHKTLHFYPQHRLPTP